MNGVRPGYRRRSLFGPLLIVAIGVVFLLANLGYIHRENLGWWFARYWPLLLIIWGVAHFLEYLWARSRNEPYAGISGGNVVLLVFLILIGLSATGISRWGIDWDPGNDWGDWGFFGNRYEFTENFATAMPTGAQVRVLSALGDISITPSPDDQAHVFVHKYIRGDSQDEANQFNSNTHPKFEQQGSVWLLDLTSGSYSRGRFNLELKLPAKYAVSLMDRRGDIRVSQLQADVDLETDRGDIMAEQIKGNTTLHVHHGDMSAKGITGNLNVDGSVDDSTVSDVTGSVTLNGSYSGDIQLTHIGGPVHFTSSRTDLQFAKLDGDLSMDGSDLKANSLAGPFSVRTDAKDIHLENVTGSIRVQDRTGDINVEAKAPLGDLDIATTGGEISVRLPGSAGFQLDAESDGGEIQNDFGLNVNNMNNNAVANATVGKGGPQVRLKTSRGTIHIRKD